MRLPWLDMYRVMVMYSECVCRLFLVWGQYFPESTGVLFGKYWSTFREVLVRGLFGRNRILRMFFFVKEMLFFVSIWLLI